MVTTDDMISAARDAFGIYLKESVRSPSAKRTMAPVKIPERNHMYKSHQFQPTYRTNQDTEARRYLSF